MADEKTGLDILEFLEQTVDAGIDAMIERELEKKGDAYTLAMYALLNEYGISGRKAIEFIQKISNLSKMFGVDTSKGVSED